MKSTRKNSKSRFACIVAVSAAIVFLAFLEFGTLLKRDLKSSTEAFLSELNIQHSNALRTKINSTVQLLEALSAHIAFHENPLPDRLPVFFAEQLQRGSFQRICLTTPDKISYSNEGITPSTIEDKLLQRVSQGDRIIRPALPGTPNVTGDSLTVFIPFRFSTSARSSGVLECTFSLGLVQTLFDDSFLKEQGAIYIVDKTGAIILSHPVNQVDSDSILTLLRQTSPEENSVERVSRDLMNGREGSADFAAFGEKYYADYRPLGINDWFVVSTISDNFIAAQSRNIAYLALMLCFFVVLAFAILLGYILRSEHRSSQTIEESREELSRLTGNIPGGVIRCLCDEEFTLKYASDGFLDLIGYTRDALDDLLQNKLANVLYPPDMALFRSRFVPLCVQEIEIEHRLVRQDGSLIWVTCKGKAVCDMRHGFHAFDCVLIDITDKKKILDDLYLSEERHRLLTEVTDTIVYEYDIPGERLTLSEKWNEKFPPLADRSEILNYLKTSDLIHEKDKAMVFNMLENLKTEKDRISGEFRLKDTHGEYLWCKAYAVLIRDKDGHPNRLLGRINDIHLQKQEQEQLEERARRDPLCGIYNKGASVSLIESVLAHAAPEDHHALMIIDIDNFKSINDNLGHLFGDAVLSGIANDLKKLFRTSDIIGRIGGDEFIVFLRNVGMESFIAKISHTVCETLRTTFAGEHASYTVSGSIGVAIYPQHGRDYAELFKKADTALYQAKEHGKNRYVIYDTAMEFCLFAEDMTTTERVVQRPAATSSVNHDIVAQLLEMFYDVKDVNVAISFALRYISRIYSIKRAFICELSADRTQLQYSYEWCSEGVTSLKESIKSVPFVDAKPVIASFNDADLLIYPDTTSLPAVQAAFFNSLGVFSIVANVIREEGVFKGVIGFEEDQESRIWTKEEVLSLSLASKIIGMSLVKMRTLELLRRTLQITETVMDMQTLWVYVINRSNYELLYMNNKTQQSAPDAHLGDFCYKALMNRDVPCRECPLQTFNDWTSGSTVATITNPYLGLQTECTMSSVPWEGTDQAVLVCCVDSSGSGKALSKTPPVTPSDSVPVS